MERLKDWRLRLQLRKPQAGGGDRRYHVTLEVQPKSSKRGNSLDHWFTSFVSCFRFVDLSVATQERRVGTNILYLHSDSDASRSLLFSQPCPKGLCPRRVIQPRAARSERVFVPDCQLSSHCATRLDIIRNPVQLTLLRFTNHGGRSSRYSLPSHALLTS